jgi:hypothetical protein
MRRQALRDQEAAVKDEARPQAEAGLRGEVGCRDAVISRLWITAAFDLGDDRVRVPLDPSVFIDASLQRSLAAGCPA